MDDIDEVVLLDGVEDLYEAWVAEKCRGAGRREYGAGPRVVGGEQMHADGAAQFLVDRTPAAETVQTGDALLESVASGELVTTVQFGRGDGGFGALPFAARVRCGLLRRVLGFRRPVGRGLARLRGQRIISAVVGHVDGSRATFRHRRSCLPIRCAYPTAMPIVPTVGRYARHTAADDGCAGRCALSVRGARAPCRPWRSVHRYASASQRRRRRPAARSHRRPARRANSAPRCPAP